MSQTDGHLATFVENEKEHLFLPIVYLNLQNRAQLFKAL